MSTTRIAITLGTAVFMLVSSTANAQILDRLERRAERNARQLARQANRADYYNDQSWQTIDPWVREYGIAPLQRTANAVRNTADAVGNTAARTVDAADGRMDSRYGFRSDSPGQQWFYDYYSYAPTYYYGQVDGNRYAGAIRYFDADNDGVYESQSRYRDNDEDGVYDEFDRVDFYVSGDEPSEEENSNFGLQDARRHRVQGEIAMTKSAQVNHSKHLIIGLKEDKETLAIDLGPATDLRGRQVEVGMTIVATGTFQEIGEKRVLIADELQIGDGQRIEISRSTDREITGQVVDVKSTEVGSTKHYMAIIEVDGERQLVDLGPTESYKVAPSAATQVVVHGVPVLARGHRILLANRVRFNGDVFTINRSKSSLQ